MHNLLLTTNSPFDHAVRVLDLIRVMGFAVQHLALTEDDGKASILVRYRPQGALSTETFEARLRRMHGLTVSQHSIAEGEAAPC